MKTVLLIIIYVLTSTSPAVADFKKKVVVEPFQNPPHWAGLYNPGELLVELVKNKIVAKGDYRIVTPMPVMKSNESKEEPEPMPGKVIDDKMEGKPPSMTKEVRQPGQVVIHGRILTFKTKTLSSGKGKNPLVEEISELEVEVTMLNPKNNRVFAIKNIRADAKREKLLIAELPSLSDQSFLKSSLGVAMETFANDAYTLLNEVSRQIPFEADIIGVDEKKNEVIINIGANDGVRLFDSFSVIFPTRYYQDPLNHADLGDLLKPMGIIKTTEVQENIARAQIIAGDEIKTGNLVRVVKQASSSSEKAWWEFRP